MIEKHDSGCYKVTIPIYLQSFYVSIGVERASKLTGEEIENKFSGMVKRNKSGKSLMVLCDLSHEVIGHECHHMLLYVCEDLGIIVDPENQEPTAYLQGFINEQVYKCIELNNSTVK